MCIRDSTSSLHSRPIFLPPAARIYRQEAPVHSPTRPRCEGGKRPHRSHRKQLFRRNRKTISFKAPLMCNRVTNSLSIVFLRLPLLTFTLSTPNMHTKKHKQNHFNKHPITSLPPPPIVLPLPEPESLDSKLKCFDELIQQLESTVEAQKKEIQV